MTIKHPRFWGPGRAYTRVTLPAMDVQAVITDVDGCLTDGRVYYPAEGVPMRAFNVKDGVGHEMLVSAGIKVAWLTSGKRADSTLQRAETIGVEFVDAGSGDKGPRFLALCERMGVEPETVVYLGDDVLDLPAMEHAGLTVCPADAADAVAEAADVVLGIAGGDACFRALAELIVGA